MLKTIKIILGTIILSCGIILFSSALAEDSQATPTPAVSPTSEIVQPVQASDLDIKEPKLLPDNPFYFLKEWKRNVQMLLTINTVNKTELAGKIANEKLIELQKLTEKGVSPELIQKATEKYQQQVEKVKKLADKIKGTAENNPEVNKFLNKFTRQQEFHEQILQKLEQQVPPAVLEKIKDARENHLEKFKQVMQKLETRKDQVKEKLEKVCIQLYDPVCGKDGKTYGNSCLAKVSGVEVAHEGECSVNSGDSCKKDADCVGSPKRSAMACVSEKCEIVECKVDNDCPQAKCAAETATDAKCIGVTIKCVSRRCVQTSADCNYYYWIDNTNRECGLKQFCGMFMYLGLKTFPTKEECLKNAKESSENILGKSCSADADCGNPNPATPQPGSSVIQYRCVQNKCMLEL